MSATNSRCQCSSVAGVTKKLPQPSVGSSRDKRREQHPVSRLQLRSADLSSQHRKLMPQYQEFDVLRRTAQHPQARQLQHPARHQIDP
ncbi:hypothetical protein ABZT43_33640 [Streptomyces sp. NPDC005349]|uniref:hypothetical protein n=1 Tax=Streptomyces sp. NPDC005349 TaxID=3157037 RepID=UPI0033B5BCD6